MNAPRKTQPLPRGATCYTLAETPVGPLTLTASPRGLSGVYFENRVSRPGLGALEEDPDNRFLALAAAELAAYFAGRQTEFSVPVSLEGTDFQKSVWQALRSIPYGQTTSYGEIATRIANPKAVRAVGLATGANPVSIIVPCHRVVGKNGSLTGFGGGLSRKEALLRQEGAIL